MEPRGLFTLRELIARLRPFEPKGIDPEHTVFTDLRSGRLHAVARYPKDREGCMGVPTKHWESTSLERFLGQPNRIGKFNDIFIPVSILADAERKRLAIALRAARESKWDLIEQSLKSYFENKGWLDEKADPNSIVTYCGKAEERLGRDVSRDVITTAYVRAEDIPSYLAEISDRLGPGVVRDGFRWDAIYGELLRMMLRDPMALDRGHVQSTLKDLHKWALTKFPEAEVPAFKTLRTQIDDEIVKPSRLKRPK